MADHYDYFASYPEGYERFKTDILDFLPEEAKDGLLGGAFLGIGMGM